MPSRLPNSGLRRAGLGLLLLVGLAAGAAAPAAALTISRVSSPVLHFDPGDSLYAAYAAYRIVNDGGPARNDVWVEAAAFSGPQIALAPLEDGRVRLGSLAAGDTTYAYFYFRANAAALVAETHWIRVYEGEPPGGTLLGSQTFSLTAETTIAASSNKVTTVVSGPNPPGLGGLLTITVNGETGTIGAPPVFSMTPSAFLNWPAESFQIEDVVLTMTGSANAGTYRHDLHYLLPSAANTQFTIVYTIRIVGLTPQATLYYPVQSIASGSQVKHTTSINPLTIPPILPANNHLTLEKTATPTLLTEADTVTYTVTLTNTSPSLDLAVEDIHDRLPSSPGTAALVPGSVLYQGAPFPDPQGSGQSLLFLGPFDVPATATRVLSYRVAIPAALGTYSNEAWARVGDYRIDRTLDPTDDVPAVEDVTVSEAQIGLAKRVLSGPVNNGDGTYTLTYALVVANTGGVALDSVQVVDDLAAAFAGASSFSVDAVSVASGPLTPNPGYTGLAPDTGILAGTDTMAAGGFGEIHVAVTVAPGSSLGPYANGATVRAVGLGVETTDVSVSGSVPDANGNGDPTDDSGTTDVTFAEAPELGVAKRVVTGPVNNGDGTYTLTYAFVLANTGDVELRSLQLTDDLAAAFSGAVAWSVDNVVVTSGAVTPNPGFTGAAPNTAILSGADTLAAGSGASVRVTVTVEPGSDLGPYLNSASGAGTSPAGTPVGDLSVDGADPDANDNGDPGDDTGPTGVSFTEAPELGAAKRVLAGPVNNGDGTYTLTFAFVLENSGDVEIRGLRLADNLAGAFASSGGFTVSGLTLTGGSVTLNPAFTGVSPSTGLLAGTDVFPPGAQATLRFDVTITPGSNLGPYANTAVASGTSPAGASLADLSADGSVPDANGNGNPGDDSASTPVSFTESPELGAAKRLLASPVNNGDGTYAVTYAFVLRNSGDVEIRNLQLADDLGSVFAGAAGFSVNSVTVTGGSLTVNPAYTGTAPNTSLLSGADELPVGATATLEMAMTVTPGGNLGPYANGAIASGTSPAGAAFSDLSADGSDPDANGNGDPGDDSGTTATLFTESPELGAAKRIVNGPVNNQDGTFSLAYRILVQNSGDTEVQDLQIVDDLGTVFAGAAGFVVDGVSVASGNLTLAPGYTGTGPGTALLAGSDVLPAGQSAAVDLAVTVTPGSNFGPYGNQAAASGRSPAGTALSDLSTQGAIPDADGNGDPGNDAAPTVVLFSEDPGIGLAKALLLGPVNNGDGTYDLTFRFVVENAGDVVLDGLSITEDLSAAFPGVIGFSVGAVTVAAGSVTPNLGFTGTAPNTNLLSGADALAVGAAAIVDLAITVTPGSNLGPFGNVALAAGASPGGALATDVSVPGSVPDANGNGDPGDDSGSVTVVFSESPELGLAKRLAAGPANNGDGSYTFTYSLVVQNSGDVALSGVQIVDDLAATFVGAVFAVDAVAITGGALTLNPAYSGSAPNTGLLAGTDALAAGASASLDLTVTVTPGGNPGPYGNSAEAAALSPAGTALADLSANGASPDANGNGNPGDDFTPTPVTFSEAPALALSKALVAGPVNNGDGTYTLAYSLAVQNPGDIEIRELQLADDLAEAFLGVAGFTVDAVTVTGGSLVLDSGFTGIAPDTNLLAGTDVLPPAGSASLRIDLTVTPGSNLSGYTNVGSVRGRSPGGADVAAGDDAPQVGFSETPRLGAAKRLRTGPVNNGDGTYTVVYSLLVENGGDIEIRELQLAEDLAAAFAGAVGFTVDAVVVTSGTLTVNPGYTGVLPNTAVLTGNDILSPSESASLDLTVTVTPGANLGPYANQAAAVGVSPAGAALQDLSTDGAVPDANGNGDPGDDDAVTRVSFAEAPQLGLAKRISSGPTSNGDGTFTLTYEFRIENSGDVPLLAAQITEDLAAAFPGVQAFSASSVTILSGTATANPAFTGILPNAGLLSGSDTLAPGAAAVVALTVTVTPSLDLGPFSNSALASASSPAGTNLSDVSADGSIPDANGNGDPTDDSGTTVITFVPSPEIGLAKLVSAGPASNGDGSFTLTYRILVENSGDVGVDGVHLSDDLGATFAAATSFTLDAVTSPGGALTLNPGFTGVAPDTMLLAGTDLLAAGEQGAVEVTVTVVPGAALGPYGNAAYGTGTAAGGSPVGDRSTEGSDPDANGNGDPTDDSEATEINFFEAPVLGAAKAVVAGPTQNGDGSQTLTYRILVRNYGDVSLGSLQIGENLGAVFSGALGFALESVTVASGSLTLDAAFTGTAPDTALLTGADALAPGAEASVDLTVTVNPGASPGPYGNQVWASATSPAGALVADASTSGLDPDPDGNGDPTDDSETTETTFTLDPATLLVEKHADQDEVVMGDFVGYRVLLTNPGIIPVESAVLRDRIPAGFAYVPGSGRVVRPGPDSLFETSDDTASPLEPAGAAPLEFGGLDLAPGERLLLSYRLRVGSGVTFGSYENLAVPLIDGVPIGNTASASVRVGEDPLFDRTTVLGKVFLDHDGDGWQDPTDATGVVIRGGFPPAAYRVNSTTLDRGDGPQIVADRRGYSQLLEGITVGTLPSRHHSADLTAGHRVVFEVVLEDPMFADLWVTTAEGTRLHMTPDGRVVTEHEAAVARGTNGQRIELTRRLQISSEGTRLILTLTNLALRESGVPGARVVTPEGFVIETDALGRFHLADVDGGRWERGRNQLMKVDPASLPPGSTFTTENPRMIRMTPALMEKVNFGVRIPEPDSVGTGLAREDAPAGSPAVSAGEKQALPGGGAVWATVLADPVEPRLAIGAPEVALLPAVAGGGPAATATAADSSVLRFTVSTNYASFLDRWEIAIHREDDPLLVRPVRVLSGTDVSFRGPIPWDGRTDNGSVMPGETYWYVLRVYDAQGRMDETAPRSVRFVDAGRNGLRTSPLADHETPALEGREIHDGQTLRVRSIPVEGASVRIHGAGAAPETRITVDGSPVPRASDGSFAVETLLPVGPHALPVAARTPEGEAWESTLSVEVPEDRFFMVGIADVTVGQNHVTGHVEPLAPDDRFDGDVFVDGRVAFHLKGKVKGKYLMTAHLDTGEEGLDDLFDNLHEKDARGFLRRLDPDRYYPVYGDESTTLLDAPSQGKLYARMEWDRSSVLWGNFQTGLTGAEFAQYNRSLYGAKLEHRSVAVDDLGTPRTELTAFASEQQTAMAHDEFRGTGGSLYYLNHADVVQGSEKAWVEVRDRDSQRVLENTALVRGRDYEIDEIQGRIILSRPLTAVADQIAPSILRDQPLDGNTVLLLVDYEYVPEGFRPDRMSYGIRARGSAADVVGLGGTFAHETRDETDYELRGVDASLRSGRGTYLKGEYAESEARQATSGTFSGDGGLTFSDLPGAFSDSTTEGAALGIEGRLDVGELTGGGTDLSAGGWWKKREAGFNTARLETPNERIDAGGEFLARLSRSFSLAGRASSLDEKDVRTELRYGLQAELRMAGRWKVSAEGRRTEEHPEGGPAEDATLGGLRLAYDLARDVEIYGTGQATLERSDAYAENNLGTLGLRARVTDFLGVRAEGSAGNRGDAVRLALDMAVTQRFRLDLDHTMGSLDPRTAVGTNWRLARDHEVYGTYTLSPDRTEGKRGVMTFGQRKALSSQLRIFNENQFSRSEERTTLGTVFGLDFRPTNRWTVGLSVERSRLDDAKAGEVDRDAVSLSAGFTEGKARAASKLEYRRDRGGARRTQWLTTNRVDYPVLRDLTLTGKFSLSTTDDERDPRGDARFVESGVGFAYRQGVSDRWQILGKYAFLLDLPGAEQLPARLDRRMHVVSTEGMMDVTRRVGVGAKVAGRWLGSREDRNTGAWYASNTYLLVARGSYHVVRGWDALAEYRWLRTLDGNSNRQGALFGLYRALGANLKAGAGFNFTNFSDDLTELDYDQRGVFLNVVGVY